MPQEENIPSTDKNLAWPRALSLLGILSALYLLVDFLLPLETVPAVIVMALVGYAALEYVLTRLRFISNFFDLVDQNAPCLRETIFIIAVPAVLALICAWLTAVPMVVLLMGFWLICALHIYLSRTICSAQAASVCRLIRGRVSGKSVLLWVVSILIVISVIPFSGRLAFNPHDLKGRTQYKNFGAYLNATRSYGETAVLFAAKVPKKRLDRKVYPLGYCRFEETNVYDDVGYVLLQALALRLGYEPCGTTNALINRALFIGGGILLAFTIGAVVCRSPVGFLAVGAALLVAHADFYWYLYGHTDMHGAAIGMVLIGMALACSIPVVLRRCTYSGAVWWASLCGLAAGIIALVRHNTGLSVFAACVLAALMFTGLKRKGLMLAVILAILCGKMLVSRSVKLLFAYRDAKMQITQRPRSEGAHGMAFSLLGGVGAAGPNSIGMKWDDGVIQKTVFSENPLVEYIGRHQRRYNQVARKIFLRYISEHPGEFARNVIRKAYILIDKVMDEAAGKWGTGLLMLLIILSLGTPIETHWGRATDVPQNPQMQRTVVEVILTCIVFAGITSLSPVATQPEHFFHETAVALLAATVVAIYGLFFLATRSIVKRASDED